MKRQRSDEIRKGETTRAETQSESIREKVCKNKINW